MKTEKQLIDDLISMIKERNHSKIHLNVILSKYQGHELLKELDRFLDTLQTAESNAFDYEFYNRYKEIK